MSVAEQADSSEQVEDDLASRMRVIYEERSDCWINVSRSSLLPFCGPVDLLRHPQY